MGVNAVRFTGENHGEVLRFAFPSMNEEAMQEGRLPVIVGTAQGPTRVKPWDWVVRHEDGTLEVVDQVEFMRRQANGYQVPQAHLRLRGCAVHRGEPA